MHYAAIACFLLLSYLNVLEQLKQKHAKTLDFYAKSKAFSTLQLHISANKNVTYSEGTIASACSMGCFICAC